MKRLGFYILLLLLCACQKQGPAGTQSGGQEGGEVVIPPVRPGFTHRIAPVSSGDWIDASKQLQVQDEIDRMAEGGINMVVVGSFKFMPMYFVDYSGTPYADAVQMPAGKITSQTAAFKANIDYAHQKGIKVLSGSYSHYCPLSFWRARQSELNPDGIFSDSWLLSVHQDDVFQSALDGSNDGVVPHQQWNNPCFKDFFVWSTKAMLDVLPDLDGFLNCYAESAWTYNLDMLKAGKSESSSRDMEQTNRDFIDYMNTIYGILQEKKGSDKNFEIGIRDWYMHMSLLTSTRIPVSKVIISVKYGGYDQPVQAVPQWGLDLMKMGFTVIFDMLVYDAEFPHPVFWYDAAFIQGIIRNLRDNGVKGFAYQDYRAKSHNDEANPLRLLTQKTVAASIAGEPFTQDDALDFLTPIYGTAASYMLESLSRVTAAQADNIKLTPAWFWKGDGLTVGGLAYNRLWKFGDNSPSEGGRMAFIRQDVVGIPEYCEAAINDVKSPGYLETAIERWHSEGRRTPYEAIADMEKNAEEALADMLSARSCNGSGERFGEIFASAVIHRQLVLRDVACMKGTLCFVLSGGQIDGSAQTATSSRSNMIETGIHKEAEALEYFTEHVRRDLILRELCALFAPRRPSLDDPKGYSYISKPCTALGKTFVMPALDTEELEALVKLIKN